MTPEISKELLLVLSAPSGAGKTTLARRLLSELGDACFSISYTTRQPRGQERDGVDYHFVDTRSFQEKIDRGEFLEWAEVHNHFYGTDVSVIEQARKSHGVAVFDIDVQGGAAIKRQRPDAILVFVLPPSMDELERRLKGRQTDHEDTIRRRLLAARAEIERGLISYDYLVINDDFETAYRELRAIVTAERCRRGRRDVSAFGFSTS